MLLSILNVSAELIDTRNNTIIAADQAFINAGVDFDVPFNSPAVKYIRVEVKDTWFGLDYTYIEEMSFYGNPQ